MGKEKIEMEIAYRISSNLNPPSILELKPWKPERADANRDDHGIRVTRKRRFFGAANTISVGRRPG